MDDCWTGSTRRFITTEGFNAGFKAGIFKGINLFKLVFISLRCTNPARRSFKCVAFPMHFFVSSFQDGPLVIAFPEATFNFPELVSSEKTLEQMEPHLETNKRFIACAATTGRAELLAFTFEGLIRLVGNNMECEQLQLIFDYYYVITSNEIAIRERLIKLD